jgi:hypothetical protein
MVDLSIVMLVYKRVSKTTRLDRTLLVPKISPSPKIHQIFIASQGAPKKTSVQLLMSVYLRELTSVTLW